MAEIEEEKVFEHFLHVPENVRMKMIDKMKTEDRCRMTRCSKSCSREARSSKNYFYILELCSDSEDSLNILVTYEKNSRTHGYSLFFSRGISGRKQMKYFTLINQGRPTWQIDLNSSTDFVQYAIEHFKKLLRDRKNEIKQLHFLFFSQPANFEMWRNVDFEVDSLNNLQSLSVHYPIDVQQFLSKIHHPLIELNVSENNTPRLENFEQIYHLQSLAVYYPIDVQQFLSKIHHPLIVLHVIGHANMPRLENFEQIYQLRYISWTSMHLDYQQLLRLSANSIEINIGTLTERNIFNFIRSWQNGTIGRDIVYYRWQLRGSNFDGKKLLRLLRVAGQEAEMIEIKHFEIPGKRAILHQISFAVTFGTSIL